MYGYMSTAETFFIVFLFVAIFGGFGSFCIWAYNDNQQTEKENNAYVSFVREDPGSFKYRDNDLIERGRSICTRLDSGEALEQIKRETTVAADPKFAMKITIGAAEKLCPEQSR